MPTQRVSAYMIFSHMNRDKIKKHNPNLSFGGLGKIIDSIWKKLPIEEKNMYMHMSKNYNKQN